MNTVRTRGDVIRARRRDLGETQQAFAAACGIDRSVLAEVESGRRPRLSLEASMRVSRRLGITVNDFTEFVDDPEDSGDVDGDRWAGLAELALRVPAPRESV